MHERFKFCGTCEVAGLLPEEDVRQHHQLSDRRVHEFSKVRPKQNHAADNQRAANHEYRRGNDAANAANPKVPHRERAGVLLLAYDSGNQESGDDKEHINANKPTGPTEIRMKQQHQDNSHRAEAIDIGTVAQLGH